MRGKNIEIEQHTIVDGGRHDATRLVVPLRVATWTHLDGDLVFTAPAHAVE